MLITRMYADSLLSTGEGRGHQRVGRLAENIGRLGEKDKGKHEVQVMGSRLAARSVQQPAVIQFSSETFAQLESPELPLEMRKGKKGGG